MIETPHLTQAPALQTAFIRVSATRANIQQIMDPAIQEVYAALAAQGIAPAGPLITYHHRVDPEIFDFEVSVPVATPVAPVGRVQAGHLPTAKVARTVYQGPYEGLHAAWEVFMKWVHEAGHQPAPGLWERYLAGPESSSNPSDWRTELNRALLG